MATTLPHHLSCKTECHRSLNLMPLSETETAQSGVGKKTFDYPLVIAKISPSEANLDLNKENRLNNE